MRKKKEKKQKTTRNNKSVKKKAVVKRKKRVIKSRVEKTRNGKTYTEAQYFQKIRNGLRSAFRFWIPMMNCLKRGSRPSQSSNKRLKTEYLCVGCQNWFPRTGIQIDHKIPCGELNKYEDIVPFIINLTQEDENAYQLLCKYKCHKTKTEKEKAERAEKRKGFITVNQ